MGLCVDILALTVGKEDRCVFAVPIQRGISQGATPWRGIGGKMYQCVCDRWDREGGQYASVVEFLKMCQSCFGETPLLREQDGSFYEGTTLILQPQATAHLEVTGKTDPTTRLRAGNVAGKGKILASQKWGGPKLNRSMDLFLEWANKKAEKAGCTLVVVQE